MPEVAIAAVIGVEFHAVHRRDRARFAFALVRLFRGARAFDVADRSPDRRSCACARTRPSGTRLGTALISRGRVFSRRRRFGDDLARDRAVHGVPAVAVPRRRLERGGPVSPGCGFARLRTSSIIRSAAPSSFGSTPPARPSATSDGCARFSDCSHTLAGSCRRSLCRRACG